MLKTTILLLAAGALVLLFTACSSEDKPAPTRAPDVNAPPPIKAPNPVRDVDPQRPIKAPPFPAPDVDPPRPITPPERPFPNPPVREVER